MYSKTHGYFDIFCLDIPNYDLPSNCFFSVHDVFSGQSYLQNVKIVGPDSIFGVFLFYLRHTISFSLWIFFRRFLDEITFPDLWKISSVNPILKSGNASQVTNYEPISIVSHVLSIQFLWMNMLVSAFAA